ncbi:MAG: SMC-Scp complex subunit ScpB [Thermoplasmatales archaeon]|nr:SMC-Scp complex subunit ScpB [Thermoplasmatales archaeon]
MNEQVSDSRVVEAALFSAGRPLTINEIKDATGLSENVIADSLEKLITEYNERDTALEVSKAGEKYVMQVKTGFAKHVVSLAPKEIPDRLLKTLALIGYHQPVKQVDLMRMLGAKVYEHVHELNEIGLVHAKKDGRTKILTTTKRFPEYFGINTADRKKISEWLAKKAGVKMKL